MKYKFNISNITDEEQSSFIDNWLIKFPKDIKKSWPNIVDTKCVIESGIIDALNKSLTVMQIYDYFAISHPGIMHLSSEIESEQEKIYELFESIMKDIVIDIEKSAQQGDAPETSAI